MAGVGAWAQDKAEPLIPDALDQGERPFIQPFMTRMASDHYALDVSRAHTLLGWQPKHRLADELPAIVATLRSEEHTSELQSLMRISYAVFCLKTQNRQLPTHHKHETRE